MENRELLPVGGFPHEGEETIPTPSADLVTASSRTPGLLGEGIPGYEIRSSIHGGSQGDVYEAIQQTTRRRVALKVLRHGSDSSIAERKRFQREIDVVAGLHHPNIVTLYDSGVAHGRYYFAMELVQGERLDTHLATHHLEMRERLVLFWKICSAVGYAHKHGVIHRDLKPQNILVDTEGEPRILDFGLAKFMQTGAPGIDPDSTRTGMFVGTFGYASPEQARGATKELDASADVYSLGMILYEGLAGRRAYEIPPDLEGALRAIAEAQPVRPSRINRDVDGELETILLKTLSKESDRRYPSALELAEDIARYLEGAPIHAKRNSFTYMLRKRTRRAVVRHAWAAYVAVAAVAFVAAHTVLQIHHKVGALDFRFDSIATSLIRRPSSSWSPDVVIVEFDDETFDAIPTLAKAAGIDGVTINDRYSWRRLHGAFMKRLTGCGPSVVAWDIDFRKEIPEHDGALVAGIEELRRTGTRVIVAVSDVDNENRPLLSPAIARSVDGVGWLWLRQSDATKAVNGAALAFRDSAANSTASLSLVTYANHRHPDAKASISWDGYSHLIEVNYAPTAGVTSRTRIDHTDLIEFSNFKESGAERMPPGTRISEQHMAYSSMIVPPRSVLAANTISYRTVLENDLAELRSRLGGKVLVVGEARRNSRQPADYHAIDNGRGGSDRGEFGCCVHAAAVSDLLQQVMPHRPGFGLQAMLAAAAAVIGLIAGRVLRAGERAWRLALVMVTLCAAVFVCGLFLALEWQLIISPTSLIAAACIATIGSAWIARVADTARSATVPTDSRTPRVAEVT